MRDDMDTQAELVHRLQTATAFPDPADDIQHLETHISHILLAGDFAYKIKKPVDLGFLDFSTLEKRRHFCEEELRLNRRLAPETYLRVVPITGDRDRPRVAGDGPVLEYAVMMRRFPQSALLTRVTLNGEIIDRLAAKVAGFHAVIPQAAPTSPFGSLDAVFAPMAENFVQIQGVIRDSGERQRLDRLGRWTRREFERLEPALEARKAGGWVRECHGDMHLGNMALNNGQILIFDGIEFNPALRWIDVISDVAFLLMDLCHRGQQALGWRFLDAYLQCNGDYQGLRVLRFYQVYRAMVRAKVAAIRLGQPGLAAGEQDQEMVEYREYVRLADDLAHSGQTGLILTMGVSGSGKTTLTQPLLERLPAIRIRSDVERKRLFGLTADSHTHAGRGEGIYRLQATDRTYGRLLELARVITDARYSVIVDATFLKQRRRAPFLDFAGKQGLPCLILEFHASEDLLRERVAEREAQGRDASEAGLVILESQLAGAEPLNPEEREQALRIDSAQDLPLQQVLEKWRDLVRSGSNCN